MYEEYTGNRNKKSLNMQQICWEMNYMRIYIIHCRMNLYYL